MSYKPKPLSVHHIHLDQSLQALAEDLAKNTHELWSQARLLEGWKLGPQRDDTSKETPCLVPYEQLPESEKEFDRLTSQGALKFILAKGFLIQPPKLQDKQDVAAIKVAAQELLNRGECIRAHDLILTAQVQAPEDRDLVRLRAMALSRLGMAKSALRLFHQLLDGQEKDREVWGMIGRSYRTLYEQEHSPSKKQDYLLKALDGYDKAHELEPGPWTLINRATIHALMGNDQEVNAICRQILQLELQKVPSADRDWIEATNASASLLMGDVPQAKKFYRKHADKMRPLWGMIASTRRSLLLLTPLVGKKFGQSDLQEMLSILQVPAIKCFYPSVEFQKTMVSENDIGVCVPFPGSATKFAQEIVQQGGQLYIILPCNPEQFIQVMKSSSNQTYVTEWEKNFSDLVACAKECVIVGDDYRVLDHTIRDYLERVAFGMSVLKSMEIASQVEVIGRPIVASHDSNTKVMALVFADAVNFSKLKHEHFPIFENEVWGLVHELLVEMKIKPNLANTWGDGLYMVLENLSQAARFTLLLAQRMSSTDWQSKGLPKDIGLRIGVHAGPVYEGINPLTQHKSYIGASVCRAARIEPITPPGQVFVSQEFAALLASEYQNQFNFSYVGTLSMAKNYGSFPMYRLEEARKNT